MTEECEHELEYLGLEKAGEKNNQYFKCTKCGAVIVRDGDGNKFKIPARLDE